MQVRDKGPRRGYATSDPHLPLGPHGLHEPRLNVHALPLAVVDDGGAGATGLDVAADGDRLGGRFADLVPAVEAAVCSVRHVPFAARVLRRADPRNVLIGQGAATVHHEDADQLVAVRVHPLLEQAHVLVEVEHHRQGDFDRRR